MKHTVTLVAHESFQDPEIVELINAEYSTDYLKLSDIPKDLLEEFFSNWSFLFNEVSIKECKNEEEELD